MRVASQQAGLGDTFVRDMLERDKSPSVEKFAALAQVLDLDMNIVRPDFAAEQRKNVGELGEDDIGDALFRIFIVLQDAEVELDKRFSTKQFSRYAGRLLLRYLKTGELPSDLDAAKLIAIIAENE